MCARRLFTQQCRDFLFLHALTVVCGLLAVLCGLAPVPATSIVLVPYSGFLGFLGFTYPKVVPKTTRVAHVGGLYGVWGERRYHVSTRAVLRNRSPWLARLGLYAMCLTAGWAAVDAFLTWDLRHAGMFGACCVALFLSAGYMPFWEYMCRDWVG